MSDRIQVPVFVVNGFLESGKTTFINSAVISDPGLANERVVIICCEEGEVEYTCVPDNFFIHIIDRKDDVTDRTLALINQKYRPTFVLIEYNGIWGMNALENASLPAGWTMVEQITVVDAQTFETYFANMTSIFADMLRRTATVFFNRCTRDDNFKLYRDSVKKSAPGAEIIYVSDAEGRLDIVLEEDLPYNTEDEIIELDNDSYLTWYIDMLDNPGRYREKCVEYIGIAAKPDYFRAGYFVVGNSVMTCCEDDMQFLGFVCKYDRVDFLKEGNFVKVRAEIHFEYAPEYESEGPVLYITKATTMPGQKKRRK